MFLQYVQMNRFLDGHVRFSCKHALLRKSHMKKPKYSRIVLFNHSSTFRLYSPS